MLDVNLLISNELSEARSTLSKIEDIELSIMLYKEQLQKDIEALTLVSDRKGDKKFGQINSALEFIQEDLKQYVTKLEVSAEVKEVADLPRSKKWGKRLDNNKVAEVLVGMMKKNKKKEFALSEIYDLLTEKYGSLDKYWSKPKSSLSAILRSAVVGGEIRSVMRGVYQYKTNRKK